MSAFKFIPSVNSYYVRNSEQEYIGILMWTRDRWRFNTIVDEDITAEEMKEILTFMESLTNETPIPLGK